MKLPKELLEKKKKRIRKHKVKPKELKLSKDQTQSKIKSDLLLEHLKNDIKNWMKKYNLKDILTWIEIIAIHPSNQIFQTRFEFLIAVLLSIKLEEFQNNSLNYKLINSFMHDFEVKSSGFFIEDFTPFDQLNLIPYFFQGNKFYYFQGLTGRTYEILKKLERIYIFQDAPDFSEFNIIKSILIQILNFQTNLINNLKNLQESKKQSKNIYVPTLNFFSVFEPLLKIKKESVLDSILVLKVETLREDISKIYNKIINGNYFNGLYIQASDNEFFFMLPQAQVEILFSIFKNIVIKSLKREQISNYIGANLLRHLTFACGRLFGRDNLILNIYDSSEKLITQNIGLITIFDNYLFLYNSVETFEENKLSEEINRAYKILNDAVKIIKNREKILLDNDSGFYIEVPVNELKIFKFVIYEEMDLNVSLTDLQIDNIPENQLFSMMDILIMLELLSSGLILIKYLGEREKYLKNLFTIDGINFFALFLKNNESLPDYGAVKIMIDPHLWTNFYNEYLYNKFQDNIYELIELEYPNRYNKIIRWEESQNLYECFNSFSLYGACIIKLEDKLIWIFYPEPTPILTMEDLKYIIRLFGPLYADYIQRLLLVFQELFNTYQFFGKFRLFLCPIKICKNNLKYKKYQEYYSKINEEWPLIVYSFLSRKSNLISLIFYNAEYWIEKFCNSMMNDGPKFALEQLIYSIIMVFESKLQQSEVLEKTRSIMKSKFPEGFNDYCVAPVIVRNPKIGKYRPYLRLSQTDQENVIKNIEKYFRKEQIKKGKLSSEESKTVYNKLYLEFYQVFEELISKYDESLLYFAYQQLELIEGNRYKLLIETGMRNEATLEEKFINFFKEKQEEISNLSSSTRFIIENILKFGIHGINKINIEEWGFLQALSLYLLFISQRSEFTHTEIMPFTIEIKEYHQFDEIQNPAVFNYNEFMEVEFKRKLETAQIAYNAAKQTSVNDITKEISDDKGASFVSLIDNLDNSFMRQFSFSFTDLMRIINLLSIMELYSKEFFPLTIIPKVELIEKLKVNYNKAFFKQESQKDNQSEIEEKKISQILDFISLNFNSYNEDILLPIKMLKSKDRLTLCPLIHLDTNEYLYGNECCSVAFKLWKNHILSGVFPFNISEKMDINVALQEIHSFRDRAFEDECGDIAKQILGGNYVITRLKNFKRISESLVKFPECGEIDVLAINPQIKTIFVFDSKNYYLKLIPSDIKNEIHRFVEKKKSDLKKIRRKMNFVNDNLNQFLEFFNILDIEDWKIKTGFLIKRNFPASYIPDIDVDFVFTNELEHYLQGKERKN